MDDIKDVQKTDSISRFIDGHPVHTNPFGENKSGERAYRRAERISAAIYLLTNHINKDETLRLRIREESLGLLQDMMELRSEMRVPRSSLFGAFEARLRLTISLTRLLAVSGHISTQNSLVMIEALDELGNFLASAQRSNLSEEISLSREEMLDVRAQNSARHPTRIIKDIKDTNTSYKTEVVDQSSEMSVKEEFNNGHVSVRSQNILETLQNGGFMGIKDISAHLPEYSEKMIQRELSGMVESGKILKTGLKRWSKYSVISK